MANPQGTLRFLPDDLSDLDSAHRCEIRLLRQIVWGMYDQDPMPPLDPDPGPLPGPGLLLAQEYLDGRLDRASLATRLQAPGMDPWPLWFVALDAWSRGEHDLARRELTTLAADPRRHPAVGAARSLLAWYGQQTAATLARLPRNQQPRVRQPPRSGDGF